MTTGRPSYNNTYTDGQIWAQALREGKDMLSRLEPMLTTRCLGRRIAWFRKVDSTNTLAATWATENAAEGALVLAERQVLGRGRFGRRWVAEAGKNLTFSLVLRPSLPVSQLGLIMLAASLGAAEAVSSAVEPSAVRIKWPNDILLYGKKCCGMLMERATTGARPDEAGTAIVGIGLNVNQDAFPPAFSDRATSLALEGGRLFDRMPVLAALLNHFERFYEGIKADDGVTVREAYLTRMDGVGRTAEVFPTAGGNPIKGTIAGISRDGSLLLDTGDGQRALSAGDVSFRGETVG